ncbi:MAG TPA: hypothetical protein VGE74_04765 [Gemmata sp.]
MVGARVRVVLARFVPDYLVPDGPVMGISGDMMDGNKGTQGTGTRRPTHTPCSVR